MHLATLEGVADGTDGGHAHGLRFRRNAAHRQAADHGGHDGAQRVLEVQIVHQRGRAGPAEPDFPLGPNDCFERCFHTSSRAVSKAKISKAAGSGAWPMLIIELRVSLFMSTPAEIYVWMEPSDAER